MSESASMKLFKRICAQVKKSFTSYKNLGAEKKLKSYLHGRLSVLEENHRKLSELFDEIQRAEENEDVADRCEELYDAIVEVCLCYKSEIINDLEGLVRSDSNQFREDSRKIEKHDEANLNTSVRASTAHEIRLPRITPPTFYGDYNNWRPFHDIFVSLIHNNSSISNIEKLTYLKSCLKGSAASLLDYLEINNDNYDEAWEILIKRYDHKRILVNSQLKSFFDQSIIKIETSDSIKGLLDKSKEVLHALKNLGVPVDSWDVIVIFTLLQKLPMKTQQLWEEKLGLTKELPTFNEFSVFLETRFRSLEVVCQQGSKSQDSTSKEQSKFKPRVLHLKSARKEKYSCAVCHKGQHSLRSCYAFLKLDIPTKMETVKQLGVCENCLAYNHKISQCPSEKRCYHCRQKHHSLLHESQSTPSSQNDQRSLAQPSQHNNSQFSNSYSANSQPHSSNTTSHSFVPNSNQNTFQVSTQVNPNAPAFNPVNDQTVATNTTRNYHVSDQTNSFILLATAIVRIQSFNGDFINLRALIDPGSEATFITEAAAQQLNLRKCRTLIEVSGFGNNKTGSCQSFVNIKLKSLHTSFETVARAFVFKTLTGLLPNKEFLPHQWTHIQGLSLADPSFYKPSGVDLLLGSDVFSEVVLPGIVRGTDPVAPIAQNTQLGWIVFGKVPVETFRIHLQLVDIDSQLRKFWEIEESPFEEPEAAEDAVCENHFQTYTSRLPDGRFEVSLPFKEGARPALGDSKQGALRRFLQLERRFDNNPELHKQYSACIAEYRQLNQMEEVDVNQVEYLRSPFHYVVPHHAVFKESSTTTKLRVVFDAAFKTTDGTSLNEHLLVGPKTQANIMDIILKWRTFKITLTADIEKMYRQIQMREADTFYQLIYWRDNKQSPLKLYRLKTVTFGTASAPYLATRTLNKLADDERYNYPLAAQMIRHDMYVDDLVSGADSVHEAQQKVREINQLLSSAGFHMRKWASNYDEALVNITPKERAVDFVLPFESSVHIKTLGIKWLPYSDCFSFQWIQSESIEITKRAILSTIAKLFDPLGWISPCVISAKIVMQKLWLKGLAWDAPISPELQREWLSLQAELPFLQDIRIQRWICTERSNLELELHGFSDASMKAYGAVVYLRALDKGNQIHSHLVMSKTRVAPLNTVSLPRLELCGAVMLARLLNYVQRVLQLGKVKTFAWTDSMITLCWISAPPSKWKTFVNNRVAEIQRLTNVNIWNHVPTKHNPADLASRGVSPLELKDNRLWWRGPEYLQTDWKFSNPSPTTSFETEEEMRPEKLNLHLITDTENQVQRLIEKVSDFKKLIRTIAYCRRIAFFYVNKITEDQLKLPISIVDLQNATFNCIRLAQGQSFAESIKHLTKNPTSSKHFGSLHPFIDCHGILRVGGRLRNSNLEYEQRHPIILKANHPFTQLLIREAHENTFHGGMQQMIAYLRSRYWILNLKKSVKKYIHHCTICFRFGAKPLQQLMGNLPAPRVRISRPFTHTGVDYAGPIDVKAWKGRGGKIFKGYFAIFVCLATKAMHLETVTDMTTQAFLAAFRRFTARRGICTEIYSDCGKNFVGANTELQRMLKAANFDWKQVQSTTTNVGTKWNFIPPASPHFGGLWEAGVKSVKFHLKRIVRNETLTFEELNTLLTQIEACLNSRPLCPLSDNFDDFGILTPAHFLIGTSSFLVPDADISLKNITYLDRWGKLQAAVNSFWKQWSGEYLSRLQRRPKWLHQEPQPQIGDLVLLKDERLPPSQWALARITSLVQGTDKLTRVVKLKTKSGELKRPITKICLLPSNKKPDETATI